MSEEKDNTHYDTDMAFWFVAECTAMETVDRDHVMVTFLHSGRTFKIEMSVNAAGNCFRVGHKYDFDIRHPHIQLNDKHPTTMGKPAEDDAFYEKNIKD